MSFKIVLIYQDSDPCNYSETEVALLQTFEEAHATFKKYVQGRLRSPCDYSAVALSKVLSDQEKNSKRNEIIYITHLNSEEWYKEIGGHECNLCGDEISEGSHCLSCKKGMFI